DLFFHAKDLFVGAKHGWPQTASPRARCHGRRPPRRRCVPVLAQRQRRIDRAQERRKVHFFFWRKRCQSQIFHEWTFKRSWTYVTKLIKDCGSIVPKFKSSWRGLPCLEARKLLADDDAEAHCKAEKLPRNIAVLRVRLGQVGGRSLVGLSMRSKVERKSKIF